MAKQLVKTSIVTDFQELNKRIGDIIKAYGMNQVYFYENVVKMSKVTWFKKTRTGTFTADELLKICNYINRE